VSWRFAFKPELNVGQGSCSSRLSLFRGKRTDLEPTVGTHTRSEAAKVAGLSDYQKTTALRVASVPLEAFERHVESAQPPAITKLADLGKQSRQLSHEEAAAGRSRQAANILREFAVFCESSEPAMLAAALDLSEIEDLRRRIYIVDAWMDRFVTNLPLQDS